MNGSVSDGAAAGGHENGFTLVEVVIAITIIGGAMLTILAATTSGFAFQDAARQRQTATALANQVLEQMRALPYADLQLGISNAAVPHAVSCRKNVARLYSCAPDATFKGSGEPILVNVAGAAAVPLSPNTATLTINGVSYTWTALISRTSTSRPLRLTVFVDWTWKGRDFSTNLQSLLWVPVGCVSAPAQPIAGPCAGGDSLVGQSSVATVSLRVTAKTGTAPTWPALTTPGSWTFAKVALTASRGLISEVRGSYEVTGAGVSVNREVQADDDPTNGVPDQSAYTSDVLPAAGTTSSTASLVFTGSTWSSQWVAKGTYISSTSVSADMQVAAPPKLCLVGATSYSPCGESRVEEAGSSAWDLSLQCSGTSCPTTSVTLVRVFEGWGVAAKLDRSTADPTTSTMSLTRSVPEIRIGCVTSSTCSTTSPWTFTFLSLVDASSADVQTASTLPTPPATSGSYSYRGSDSSCVPAATASVSTSSPVSLLYASGARCLSSSSSIAKDSWLYQFTNITYSVPWVSAGSVVGPSLEFDFQLLQCDNNGCASGNRTARSPVFRVRVELPAMTLSGGTVDW